MEYIKNVIDFMFLVLQYAVSSGFIEILSLSLLVSMVLVFLAFIIRMVI